MEKIAVILSGGIGSRMGGDIPKQYVEVKGVPIINYCLKIFLENNNIDALVIVAADEWLDYIQFNLNKLSYIKPIYYASPGETRQYSIYNALKIIDNIYHDVESLVIIHDAARPLVSHDVINRCILECHDCDGVMPAIPVKDTIYVSKDRCSIHSLLDRNTLFAGQSPEAFIFSKYFKAHNDLNRTDLLKINGSTELAFVGGLHCKIVDGDPMNFKITTHEDLLNFTNILNDIDK